MDVVTDYTIPETTHPVPDPLTPIDFDQKILDFLDQAETSHGLLSALPKSDPLPDESTKTSFQLTVKTVDSPCKIIMFRSCCTPAGCPICF